MLEKIWRAKVLNFLKANSFLDIWKKKKQNTKNKKHPETSLILQSFLGTVFMPFEDILGWMELPLIYLLHFV